MLIIAGRPEAFHRALGAAALTAGQQKHLRSSVRIC